MSSRRPGSGRPQSRFNPITGEETPPPERYVDSRAAFRPGSRPDSRPQEVPRLELGRLEDADAHHRPPYQHYDYKLDTPNTASTVSWGTPVPSERENFYYGGAGDSYPQTIQTPRMEAGKHSKRHDEVPVVDVKQKTVPPSSDRLYKEYGKELLEAYNQSHIVQEKVHKHMTKEDVEEEKKKQKLLDTVMVDQLSRAVISDPDQDQNIPETPPHHLPGMSRGAIRHLHESK
ncbi:calcyphosin-2-like [Lingula anatina]|uniref:Calcyphosin-2-like n=1 Tax=Lingula anatina TaxID=7574 RepID=A0A1S3IBS4_LINAN|nr:calcyphosin-2-like [Lingula anatina]|eukprot:XP_013395311.1 calcyphosin-2-like [Lingula anatina]